MDCRVKPGNDDAVSGRPCERRDPYATASLSSAAAKRLSNNRHRWLWVPAFAGTTMILTLPDCPTGKSVTYVSSPIRKNISLRDLVEAVLELAPSRSLKEGRLAIVTDVGSEMRWTRLALLTRAPGRGR